MRISDYSIIDILSAAGVEIWRSGNQTVCRCPICKGDNNRQAGHNCQVNIESNIIYCHSCGRASTRTQLADALGLRARLDIPEWDGTKEYKPKPPAHKPALAKAEPEPETDTDIKEIERLLFAEIPPILWDRTAESYKNIGLTEWNHENRLLFSLSGGTTITRNAGNIKWKWSGRQPIFNHLTDKKLVFIASGMAEWLIVDWLGVDYIVLPSDSQKARIADFKAELQGKAVIILPDADKSGSFQKVIETVKANAARVHVAGFYPDHDFRDYARRTAPEFKSKQEFINSFKLNIFAELGGSESADTVTDDEIFNLIPVGEIKPEIDADVKPEPAEPDFSTYQISRLIADIKPIVETAVMGVKIQYQAIFGVLGATSAGKTDVALQLLDEHARQGISLYMYYEGLPNEIAHRAQKKGISGQNFYAIPSLTDFKTIEKFIQKFKAKKILVATDYYQALAWRLYLDAPNKNAMIREFMTQIFVEQNRIRQTYENVCFCNIYALNNVGINGAHEQASVDPARLLGAAKEDGNVQYQADYAYCLLFSDDGGKWTLGRHTEQGKIKKYTKLATAKGARIGIETGNPVFVWEKGRYRQVDNIGNNQDDDNNNTTESSEKQSMYDTYTFD